MAIGNQRSLRFMKKLIMVVEEKRFLTIEISEVLSFHALSSLKFQRAIMRMKFRDG